MVLSLTIPLELVYLEERFKWRTRNSIIFYLQDKLFPSETVGLGSYF